MYCQNCGTGVSEISKFCSNCGTALNKVAADHPKMMFHVNLWGGLSSIVTFVVSGRAWLMGIMEPTSAETHGLLGVTRVQAIIFVGLLAAALHGALWKLVENLFDWHYGEAERSLPKGWAAATLSATMTIPLVLLPSLYARLTGDRLISRGHSIAAMAVIVVSALGHVVLYGAGSLKFDGLRNIFFPVDAKARWGPALWMEIIYAIVHFCSIVLTYRLVLASNGASLSMGIVYPTLISAALWLSGVGVFLFLTYPNSLEDPRWVEVRGIIHGLMLTIALEGGMLM